jgi:hypothetical protein
MTALPAVDRTAVPMARCDRQQWRSGPGLWWGLPSGIAFTRPEGCTAPRRPGFVRGAAYRPSTREFAIGDTED